MYKLGKKIKVQKREHQALSKIYPFSEVTTPPPPHPKKKFSLREGGWGHLIGLSHAKNRSSRKK